jgi:hypothetical protein
MNDRKLLSTSVSVTKPKSIYSEVVLMKNMSRVHLSQLREKKAKLGKERK